MKQKKRPNQKRPIPSTDAVSPRVSPAAPVLLIDNRIKLLKDASKQRSGWSQDIVKYIQPGYKTFGSPDPLQPINYSFTRTQGKPHLFLFFLNSHRLPPDSTVNIQCNLKWPINHTSVGWEETEWTRRNPHSYWEKLQTPHRRTQGQDWTRFSGTLWQWLHKLHDCVAHHCRKFSGSVLGLTICNTYLPLL